MYLDHRTVDLQNNIIVDCFLTNGNVHNSVPFISRVEYIKINIYPLKLKNELSIQDIIH